MHAPRPLVALAALAAVLAATLAAAAGHAQPPCLGATARAFLQLVSRRGVEPRVLGANEWAAHGIEPQHHTVGFCPFTVRRHRSHQHALEFECVDADSRTGCWQQYEQDGDRSVLAGCVYVPHRDRLSASAE